VAATLGTVALIWWGSSRGVGPYPDALADLTVGLLFPVAGTLVIRRQPRNAAGWVLLSGGLLSVSALSHQWAHHAAVVGPYSIPLVPVAVWLAAWTFTPYFLQTTLVPLLFPDGRLPSPRWRKVAIAVIVLASLGALASAFRPDPSVEDLGFANPLGLGPTSALPLFAAVMAVTSSVCLLGATPVCLSALVLRQRRATGRERTQLQWLLLGFVTTFCLTLAGAFGVRPGGSGADELRLALAFAVIPLCIAVAVVRHGLFDVEIVVNRAIVYGALTALGLAAYAGGLAAVGRWIPEGDAAPVVAAATAFVAALARQRVQDWVSIRLFGARNDPYAVVERVGASLQATSRPAEALARLVDALRDALALPFVAVEPLMEGAPGASSGSPVAGVEDFPAVVGGRQVACLRVGHRYSGEHFRAEERTALADVARRAGAVVQAAVLTADLQASRERIVATAEEERRRIRRDLHDGLGPALAGMALHLDGLTARLGDHPDLSSRAERLRDQLASAVSEVRRIVDGLRPAAVDELGLVEALRLLASANGAAPVVDIDVADAVPPLPAAIEVAAYRITAEALANVLRHSGARRCCITVQSEGTNVVIEIDDDGRGFGADVVSGVGLRSMHERAAEVGGEVEVRSEPGSGTCVRARLPVAVG
jgi:signal transduction histidine kinase